MVDRRGGPRQDAAADEIEQAEKRKQTRGKYRQAGERR
jgi:hypothetical protein